MDVCSSLPGRLAPVPRTNTAPPSPPPKVPTGLKREIVTPGVRRSADAKSRACRSSTCASDTTVRVLP